MLNTKSGDDSSALSALLSQVLVAFTIEFDNEFEHQTPHRTSRFGSTAGKGPWLSSMVMWWNCMRYVDAKGVKVRELERLARTGTNLNGMERWGYVVIEPDPADTRPKPPHSDWIIRATPKGQTARAFWEPLFETLEQRWETRFGRDTVNRLRDSLRTLVGQFSIELPDCLPILGYGLINPVQSRPRTEPDPMENEESRSALPSLLAKALLSLAIEFELQSDLSLAICANVIRVLTEAGVPVRDIPRLSGVSKESISMATGYLEKRGYVSIEPDLVAGRGKVVCLTQMGLAIQQSYPELLATIEESWAGRFGEDAVCDLRENLECLVGDATPSNSPLFRGLEPYPDGWRAKVPRPMTLPHFPMVLHRGGYPDGS